MKAAVWQRNKIKFTDMPEPQVTPDTVKIRVTLSTISDLDLMNYETGALFSETDGIIAGTSAVGRVIEVGCNVKTIKLNDRVAITPVTSCGKCFYCLNGNKHVCDNKNILGFRSHGGLAEYIVIDHNSVTKLPDYISDAKAIFLSSIGRCHSIIWKSGLKIGDTCVIFAGDYLGPILVQNAFHVGAKKVFYIDYNKERRDLCEQYGAVTINPAIEHTIEKIMRLNQGGVDIAFEIRGEDESFNAALLSVKSGGEIILCSSWKKPIEFNPNLLTAKERKISTSLHIINELRDYLPLLSKGMIEVDSLVHKTIPLAKIVDEGFGYLEEFPYSNRILVSIN